MTAAVQTTAVGVFFDREQAEKALDDLRHAGFRPDQVGVARKAELENPATPETTATKAEDGAIAGVVAGGAVGALAGAVVTGLIPASAPLSPRAYWRERLEERAPVPRHAESWGASLATASRRRTPAITSKKWPRGRPS